MDIDRYVAEHAPGWRRLEELARRAARPRSLQSAEVSELVSGYQRAATQLSYARTHLGDPALTARLTKLVGTAHGAVYGVRRVGARAAARRFFTQAFPAAVWASRRFVLASAAFLLVPAVAVGVWLAVSDTAVAASADPAVRAAYIEEDFEAYYSSEPATQFASEVFVNNIRVAILVFATGILLCVFAAAILAYNGVNIGVAGGLFADVGQLDRFFGLILPHGLLELSAVVVAGAAGMRLGWALIAPGDRPRAVALAEEGRRSVVILIGLVLVFLVAGLIEGFVTGRGWPTGLRVAVGVLAAGTFWLWVIALGSRAVEDDVATP